MAAVSQRLVLDALVQGRAWVEKGWSQHHPAKDADGTPVYPWSPRAAMWSADQAVGMYEGESLDTNTILVVRRLARERLAEPIPRRTRFAQRSAQAALGEWNDEPSRKVNDVLALFDLAIQEMRQVVKREDEQ